MKTDRITSAMLDFPDGKTSTFTCSTQLMPYQRVHVFGTIGHIEIEIPVKVPKDVLSEVWVRTKTISEKNVVNPVDQYMLQTEIFVKAILDKRPVPNNLANSVNNMKVIEAILDCAKITDGLTSIKRKKLIPLVGRVFAVF